ncbi:MAG: sialidase family protein [Gallionellaceae bacterium]|jgi:predicted neuraminidase
MKRGLFPLAMLAVFAGAFFKASQFPESALFQTPATQTVISSSARFTSHFASSKLFTQVHAASCVELNDGRIRAFWFSGSREGAKDVAIHSAVFDPATSLWSAEQTSVTREQTQQGLHRYIAKLGNPVVGRAADGSLLMFYVSVSLGGWAGSSITTRVSHDEGASWGEPRRLVTSPFMNISTLVKGAPFLYRDGSLGLPVYHEFLGKFSEIIRLDPQGNVRDKQRITPGGTETLQPIVFIKDNNNAQVLMRNGGKHSERRVVAVSTQDAGQHWSTPELLNLRNPDAALSGVVLPDGRMLVALNDTEHGREVLSLSISADSGKSWQQVVELENQLATGAQPGEARYPANTQAMLVQSEAAIPADKVAAYLESTRRTVCNQGPCRYEFSYPYLLQTRRGDFHLVYTWNRTFIKHLSFNQQWLDQRLQQTTAHELH